MNMTRDRVQSFAWALIISVSFALLLALTFKVNAVKSQVRLLDRRIVALKQEKTLLETEFQTRANQQQLAALNDVNFGFKAPTAAQYVEGEQQLAALSKPAAAPDAPAPILMASAEVPAGVKAPPAAGTLPAVMSTVAGNALAAAPGTRMLAQHGERVAPGGTGKLERRLALADGQGAAARKPAFAAAAPETKVGRVSGADRLARAARGRAAIPDAPPAASASFLAAATGDDRLRKAVDKAGDKAGTTTRSATGLAASRPAKKPATVADAFGSDWLRQISTGPKDAARTAPAVKAKPGHRRVALEDRQQATNP